MEKKILVIGATGLLGKPVAFCLKQNGFIVRLMEVLPKYVRGNQAFVFGKQPNPYHFLAADDDARMAAFEKIGERGDPMESNNILGAPKIKLDKWLQQKKSKSS